MDAVFIHTCDVEEYKPVGTNGRNEYRPVQSGIPCLIMPMTAEAAVSQGYTVGKAYDASFPDGIEIKTGQRLTWNGMHLHIKGVSPYQDAPYVSHVYASCTREGA